MTVYLILYAMTTLSTSLMTYGICGHFIGIRLSAKRYLLAGLIWPVTWLFAALFVLNTILNPPRY